MDNDLYSREGTEDVIARLRASQANVENPTWCDVHASNLQAAIDLLTKYSDLCPREGTRDLIAELRACKTGVPLYDWARVQPDTLQAVMDQLEAFLKKFGPIR